MDAEPLTALGLSPQAVHFLTRRGVDTVAQLCAKSARELLCTEKWLSPAERQDRVQTAASVLYEVRVRLAGRGLTLRDDPNSLRMNEPVDVLNLTPRAASLLRCVRVSSVGELLALTTHDLFATTFRPVAASELLRCLARHGLHLRDGRPYGPTDLKW